MSLWRALGPAVPRPKPAEVLRASVGAFLGVALAALVLWAITPRAAGLFSHPLLIAPFGASAMLVFAVPNSPLAQPWSVVMGNTLSAVVALAVLLFPLPQLVADSVAVGAAVAAMAAARALHPPGGAVALFVAMAQPQGWDVALSPVFVGSVVLVIAGVIWHRATGRTYPFRQPTASAHKTADAAPERRHLPAPGALAELLSRLRLEGTIGVEDLSRLITAAETEAASLPLAGLTARHLMSRDVITTAATTGLTDLAETFHHHRFKTLPVVDAGGHYLGLVAQDALVGLADARMTATDLAHLAPVAMPETPAAELVQRLADGQEQAVPIVEAGRLVGLVTRSDLIALLARGVALAPLARP